MAEYLSPGVYVEEYDSGATPMQGVSTSTAGFIGLAERGPVIGQPQLVTSFADYKRMYGGYLSEAAYGSSRFLPYAVEQFFANGGSRAYIMRAVPGDAKAAGITTGVLKLTAANPGAWAEDMRVTVSAASKAKTQVLAVHGADLTLKNADEFNVGDVVELFDGRSSAHATIKSVLDRVITLDAPCTLDVADTKVGTAKYIRTCEISIAARLGESVEVYEGLSLKEGALNNAEVKTARSDLIKVEILSVKTPAPVRKEENKEGKDGKDGKAAEPAAPLARPVQSIVPFVLCGGAEEPLVLTLEGGSNGTVLSITADAFLGKDDGPGKRTGLQAFQENNNVSIMAIPGITAPEVQAALIGYCEGKKSCFALLDVPMELKKTNDVANFRDMYDSTYAAMYHPWLEMYDAGARRPAYFPPSGAMAGIYARLGRPHHQLQRPVEVSERPPPVHLRGGVHQGQHQLGGLRAQLHHTLEPGGAHHRVLPGHLLAGWRSGGQQPLRGFLCGVRPHHNDTGRHRQRPPDLPDRHCSGEARRVRYLPYHPKDRLRRMIPSLTY